jgi:ribosomal-protein-alanine N-acetyltransferase
MLHLNFTPFPRLETERLFLKEITIEDAGSVFAMRCKEEVMQYLDRPKAKTIEDALALINQITTGWQRNESITWGLYQKGHADLIGTLGFWQIQKQHHRAEIGYMLQPPMQGKGYMSEALRAVMDYGFIEMQLHSAEANVNPSNERSIRLLEKHGFVREAYFRENYFYDGKFLDSVVYSFVKRETGAVTF